MGCSLEEIYQEFDAPLRRFIVSRVADRSAADDILQEVYLRIHTHLGGMRDCRRLPAWIYQIARHAIVDYYRSRRPGAELSEFLPAADDPCADDINCEVVGWLGPLIDELPDRYRQALTLTVREGLTQQEVATRLGLSLSGAKSRVQRGRERLKDLLLGCCHFEFDRYGGLLDYQPCCSCCAAEGLVASRSILPG
jgi:RNA polymerase sigma-70 factor (ECF subfamily)